jgi:hypothetical protein
MSKIIVAALALAFGWLTVESASAQSQRHCDTTYDNHGRVVSKNCY